MSILLTLSPIARGSRNIKINIKSSESLRRTKRSPHGLNSSESVKALSISSNVSKTILPCRVDSLITSIKRSIVFATGICSFSSFFSIFSVIS